VEMKELGEISTVALLLTRMGKICRASRTDGLRYLGTYDGGVGYPTS